MALSSLTKSNIRNRAWDEYGEVAGGNEFSTGMMGTFIRNSVESFARLTGVILGSTRIARPSSATAEALVTLASGMFDVKRVVHERAQYGGAAYKTDVRHSTQSALALAYGSNWAYASSANVGGAPTAMRWYRKGVKYVGMFPPYLAHTAGTVVVWCTKIPDVMATDGSPCLIPPEYIPGVVADVCRQMAERDVDSDAEGARAGRFAGITAQYVEQARQQGFQMWSIED